MGRAARRGGEIPTHIAGSGQPKRSGKESHDATLSDLETPKLQPQLCTVDAAASGADVRRPCCPRCRGFLFDDRDVLAARPEFGCLQCGWRETRAPDAEDARARHRPHGGTHHDGAGEVY